MKLSYLTPIATLLIACTPTPETPSKLASEENPPVTQTEPAPLMKWSDLTSQPLPKTPHEISLGDGKSDVVDLWLPDGDGPHPVVVMVHGGCWQKGIADRTLMNYAAEDLRAKGLAVWNIEYRGVDEVGGGYPGTFHDVAIATDSLREHAETFNLNMDKVLGLGHSAGGHLVTWLSTRGNVPKNSPLYSDNPLKLHGVVNSGGLADLDASAPVTFDGCLANILDTLVGTPTDTRPNVFSDTSPVELFPTDTIQVSVNGDQDGIAPPELGKAYTEKAKAAGVKADFRLAAPSGHVELVAPGTVAFDIETQALFEMLEK